MKRKPRKRARSPRRRDYSLQEVYMGIHLLMVLSGKEKEPHVKFDVRFLARGKVPGNAAVEIPAHILRRLLLPAEKETFSPALFRAITAYLGRVAPEKKS